MKRLNKTAYLLMLYYSQNNEYSRSNKTVKVIQSNIKSDELFMIISNEKMLIFIKSLLQ